MAVEMVLGECCTKSRRGDFVQWPTWVAVSPSQKNYAVHKLEFLALKWAVVNKLRDYLYGATFVVKTDNNPLTYLLSTAKLDQEWEIDVLTLFLKDLTSPRMVRRVGFIYLSKEYRLCVREWNINTEEP